MILGNIIQQFNPCDFRKYNTTVLTPVNLCVNLFRGDHCTLPCQFLASFNRFTYNTILVFVYHFEETVLEDFLPNFSHNASRLLIDKLKQFQILLPYRGEIREKLNIFLLSEQYPVVKQTEIILTNFWKIFSMLKYFVIVLNILENIFNVKIFCHSSN